MAEAYAKAAAVIAVSGHTADMLVEHSQLDRSKTVVVHEGSDSMFLGNPEVPETRQPRLLAVSTLAPYKNLEAAIDVLARLRPQRPELVLDIAGQRLAGVQDGAGGARGKPRCGRQRSSSSGSWSRMSWRTCTRGRCCCCTYPSASRSACRSSRRCASGCRSSQQTARRCRRSPPVPRRSRIRTTVDAVASTVEAVLAGGAAELVERGHARAGELTWRATAEGIAAVVSRVAPGS